MYLTRKKEARYANMCVKAKYKLKGNRKTRQASKGCSQGCCLTCLIEKHNYKPVFHVMYLDWSSFQQVENCKVQKVKINFFCFRISHGFFQMSLFSSFLEKACKLHNVRKTNFSSFPKQSRMWEKALGNHLPFDLNHQFLSLCPLVTQNFRAERNRAER